MSANTKIVVLRRKELLYTGIFAALGVLFVILLLMLLLPGKDTDASYGTPDSPDSTAETAMPDNVADLGRIPQSAQTEDVSTGAVADTDAVLDNASGPVGTFVGSVAFPSVSGEVAAEFSGEAAGVEAASVI